jgi:hypothetical protein
MPDATPRTTSLIAAVLLVGAPLTGCLAGDAEAASGSIYVKDAVTDDAAAVNVTFTDAEVLPANENAWVSVYEGEQTVDLLSLSGSTDKAELTGLEIEPGEYDRLRLTLANATVTYENGTEEHPPVFGNVVEVGEDLSYEAGGELDVVVDFDLERGLRAADEANGSASEYVPVVGDVQRSDVDTDEDGVPDIEDPDDDGDGVPDAEDGDRDGDGQPDAPPQRQSVDKRGLTGLCKAYANNEEGRENGTAANATAFQWLESQADEAGQSLEAHCDEQAAPGAPDDLAEVRPDEMPEKARQAVEDRRMGPPEDRPGDRGDDDREAGGQDRRDGDRNRTEEDRRDGEERGGEDRREGNETRGEDRNRTADDDR